MDGRHILHDRLKLAAKIIYCGLEPLLMRLSPPSPQSVLLGGGRAHRDASHLHSPRAGPPWAVSGSLFAKRILFHVPELIACGLLLRYIQFYSFFGLLTLPPLIKWPISGTNTTFFL